MTSLFRWETLHSQDKPPQATPQRPTFTNDASTTVPGTLELEFGAKGPANSFSLPSAFKFTPAAERGLFHQLEFSLGFNSLERISAPAGSDLRFGDSLDFAVRRPVWKGNNLSFAVAPRAEVFLRDNKGSLIGGTGIAVYAIGLNSLVVNLLAMGATSPSVENPAWMAQLSGGYGRALGGSGTAGKFSVAFEVQNGFSRDQEATLSLLQGISYRPRPDFVLDLAFEQWGLRSGEFELVLQGGLTCNLGRIWPR